MLRHVFDLRNNSGKILHIHLAYKFDSNPPLVLQLFSPTARLPDNPIVRHLFSPTTR